MIFNFCIFEVQQRPWASTEAWWRCQADVRKLDRPEGCGRFPDGFSQKASEPSLARFRTRVYRFSEFYSYTPYTYTVINSSSTVLPAMKI